MTTAELIERLRELPPDCPVVIVSSDDEWALTVVDVYTWPDESKQVELA